MVGLGRLEKPTAASGFLCGRAGKETTRLVTILGGIIGKEGLEAGERVNRLKMQPVTREDFECTFIPTKHLQSKCNRNAVTGPYQTLLTINYPLSVLYWSIFHCLISCLPCGATRQ